MNARADRPLPAANKHKAQREQVPGALIRNIGPISRLGQRTGEDPTVQNRLRQPEFFWRFSAWQHS
jgi:hypothetical protein